MELDEGRAAEEIPFWIGRKLAFQTAFVERNAQNF
jgi:hypothetical protein